MSVYTHLNDDQFAMFCKQFGVTFAKAYGITQGIKNSNWFIQTDTDQADEYSYILTLFEERPPQDIEKMAIILNQLGDILPVAPPCAKQQSKHNGDSDYIVHFDDKAITLVPYLAGSHPTQTTPTMCADMGKALAVLHNTLQTLQPASDYSVPLYPWHEVRDREIPLMNTADAQLMTDIWQAYDNASLGNDAVLPKGLCHLDLFADNTLWDLSTTEPTLTGLLDFTEVSIEHYVMDIAITINDFCTTWADDDSVQFDNNKMTAFVEGYESERALTATEKQVLPTMMAMAGVTFWLLRLNVIHYNKIGGRTGDDIMVKNPELMKQLASFHWKNCQ